MKRNLFLLLAALLTALHLAPAAEVMTGKSKPGKPQSGATVALGVQWLAGMADDRIDGKLLGLVAKNGAYVYRIDGEIGRVAKAKPHYTKYKDAKIEGCSFAADGLVCTSETGAIYLFTDPPFRGK